MEDPQRSLPETPTSNQKETRNCLENPRETRCGKKKPCWARLDTGLVTSRENFFFFLSFFLFFAALLSYLIFKWALQSKF